MRKNERKWVAVLLFGIVFGLSMGQQAEAAKYVKSVKVQDAITNSTKVSYMAKGTKRKLYTSITVTKKKYNESKYKMLTIATNKPKIVSISKKGYLKAKKAGTAYITVKTVYDKKKKKIKVVVTNGKVKGITLNRSALTMNLKEGKNPSYSLEPEVEVSKADATKTLLWSSSNEAVATVDCNGVVTAVAPGKAVITAKAIDGSNKKARCNVEILRAEEKKTESVTTEMVTTEEKTISNKKTVIQIQPDAYINATMTTKGDYKKSAAELETILESASKSGDQFNIAIDGKDYTVANVNGKILISDGKNKKYLSEAFSKNVEEVSVCILYTEAVASIVNRIDLQKLQGNYSFDFEMDHFLYRNLVVDGDVFRIYIDGDLWTGTICDGVITIDGDLSKEPFFVLAVEKKWITYKITEETK